MRPHLFCFGLGYSAGVLAERLAAKGWLITGTSRSAEGVEAIAAKGWRAFKFEGSEPLPDGALEGVTHMLSSVPPTPAGDPVLAAAGDALAGHAKELRWAGYLSTTGVYGDKGGGWVDETSPLAPSTDRGHRRLAAETSWMDLHRDSGLPMHIFRLPSIYGPGRNQLESVLDGTARRIVKPGQVFSRIHVEDIAGALEASIAKPRPGAAYNVADDEPAPPQDVVAYAAQLLGQAPPPEVAFEDADLSPMAMSFYAESKRVSNRLLKEELGYRLRYLTYREGLTALLAKLPRRP
ncbi:MAG: SDR family oxidoreductase [Parvibaculaceae bacterium]